MGGTRCSILIPLVAALVLCPTMSLADGGTWTTESPMPTARSHLSASVVDGLIYAIGGCTQAVYQEYLSTVEAYDTGTDTWARKAPMPTGRARLSTSVVDGKIYAIGGSPHPDSDLSTLEVYDPATDTWTRKADMPTGRCWLSTSVVNGKVYAIGGKIYPSATMVSTVEEYDPVTDTWTRRSDMPTARMALATNVVNGKIYAIGGVATGGGAGPSLSTVEVFDPATNTWTKKADMPTPRANLSAGMLNGKIYVIGGSTGWSTVFSTLEVYDSATNTWAQGPDMPTARSVGPSAGVVDGKIYVVGGFLDPSTWAPTATVEVYDPKPLVVDLNGDGMVTFKDFSILAQYWHQDKSPFVNHRVDCEDLAVLAEYWLRDLRLLAHWKLDETQGVIAHDSAGDHEGTLEGDPIWQPTNGKLGGAVQFDGVDDYISTPLVLNPADGEFSVFAWIKGDMPGQVIVSQIGAANWLAADPFQGWLITDLKAGGRFGRSLWSETVITDGHWHRVGLTWDGSNRILYVDDVEVAKDTQSGLASSQGGIYIGAGKNREPASLWSGLIDDVRIYNRAIVP